MLDESKNICGPIISRLRAQENPPITQEDLAARIQTHGLEIDRVTVAKIETQRRRVFDYEILAFAKALKVKPATLFGDE